MGVTLYCFYHYYYKCIASNKHDIGKSTDPDPDAFAASGQGLHYFPSRKYYFSLE